MTKLFLLENTTEFASESYRSPKSGPWDPRVQMCLYVYYSRDINDASST